MSHIRSSIQLTFHLLRMSHIRNSIQPTFHLLRMSHIRNPIRRRSTFFFIFRAFSGGFKITFLIKLCCHFYFRQAIFHTSFVFKMFRNKQGINFCDSEQWSYRNWFRQDKTGFDGGPTYEIPWLIDWLIDLFAMHDWFILFLDMRLIIPVPCSLTMFHDSALPFAGQVRTHFHFGYSLCIFWFSYVHDNFRYSLFSLLDAMIVSFY